MFFPKGVPTWRRGDGQMTETDVGKARWMGMGRTEGSARRGGQKKRQGSTIEPNFLPIVNERADIQKRRVGPLTQCAFVGYHRSPGLQNAVVPLESRGTSGVTEDFCASNPVERLESRR